MMEGYLSIDSRQQSKMVEILDYEEYGHQDSRWFGHLIHWLWGLKVLVRHRCMRDTY